MEEKRRNLRTDLEAELLLKRIDGESGERVTIRILDLSKTGIGFECDRELEQGAIYDCDLTIWTKDVIRAFVQIVRITKCADGNRYGGIFIGMLDQDACRIEVHQTFEKYRGMEENP